MTDTTTEPETSTEPPGWANKIIGFDRDVDPADLLANPLNARRHPGSQRDALTSMLGQVGWTDAVKVNKLTGRVVDGHARIEEAITRGYTVPVLWLDLTEDEERMALATMDPIGSMAVYDADVMPMLLDGLEFSEPIVDLLAGIQDDAYSIPLDPPDPEPGPRLGDAPEDPDDLIPPADPITKAGDVWDLGSHRIMCGDCRLPEDVARLLDGDTINLAVTSPPYADRRKYDATSAFRPVPPEDYVGWFAPVAANVAAHLAEDGSWLVNIKAGAEALDRETYVLDLVLAHVREWGWHFGEEYCWQRSGVPGEPFLRLKNQHEPIYQFARHKWKFHPKAVMHESTAAIGHGLNDRPDDADIDPERKAQAAGDFIRHQGVTGAFFATDPGDGLAYPGNRLPTFQGSHEALGHEAAFPVGLPEFFVRLMTDSGDAVYDPFMGSGSTLLAAHRHERVGYGMEISPGYVDMICRRFQRATGLVPERAGVPHDFLADSDEPDDA